MKKVVLGITGGIAAYKAAELARHFIRGGAEVQVVMTQAATRFITPLTLQTLTGRPVYIEMFAERNETKIRHIDLVEEANLLVIAPASANTIAKMANGISDNLLTTIYLAASCPVAVIPSMNVNMFAHPALKANLDRLSEHGCRVMDPDAGELACGVYGSGRLPDPADIYKFCLDMLHPQDFQDLKALVTAGPTREMLDPVRFLSNPSTGLMGYALAEALRDRGAAVTLISGPTHLQPPTGVELIRVTSAEEMFEKVLHNYRHMDFVFKAAAVSDFRPRNASNQKVKKDNALLTLELERNRDILLELGKLKDQQILVGFAAETEDLLQNARDKLAKKNLDLIVVNDISEEGSGFAVKTNRVSLIKRSGEVEELPMITKDKLAHHILDRVIKLRQ